MGVNEKLGYSRDGDVVTLRMTIEDFGLMLIEFGYAWSAAAEKDRQLGRQFVALSNRLNVGNPAWTPYETPEAAL